MYGSEAVLPIETEIKSLRVVMEVKTSESEWARKRYNHLISLDEKRMSALFHTQIYQRRIARAFNKKVKPEKIKAGDMVLKQSRTIVFDPRGKFRPNWEGPYWLKQFCLRELRRSQIWKGTSSQSLLTCIISRNTTCKK